MPQTRSMRKLPSIKSLSDELVLKILMHCDLQTRLNLFQANKALAALASDSCFIHKICPGEDIGVVVQQAKAGHTIIIPPGYYTSFLEIRVPLKIIGEPGLCLDGGKRRSVLLETSSRANAVCTASCCWFEGIIFKNAGSGLSSAILLGQECKYMRLYSCSFLGEAGLYLPAGLTAHPTLEMKNCLIATPDSRGVCVEFGVLQMSGCTIRGCSIGVQTSRIARIHNNEFSFNKVAVVMYAGVLCNNIFWGNETLTRADDQLESIYTTYAGVAKAPSIEELIHRLSPTQAGKQELMKQLSICTWPGKYTQDYIAGEWNVLAAGNHIRERNLPEPISHSDIHQLAPAYQ